MRSSSMDGGVGGSVVDRLRQMRVREVKEVQFAGKADRPSVGQGGASVYAYKRAEMWGNTWLM